MCSKAYQKQYQQKKKVAKEVKKAKEEVALPQLVNSLELLRMDMQMMRGTYQGMHEAIIAMQRHVNALAREQRKIRELLETSSKE
jgi:uncharacterized membrane protein